MNEPSEKHYNVGKKNPMYGKPIAPKAKEKIIENNRKRRAENHPNWKGGKTICRGYVRICCPNHPYANSEGYVSEHRLIMERHLGRVLLGTEIVHHINGETTDNRIENLMLFSSHYAHLQFHKKEKKRG